MAEQEVPLLTFNSLFNLNRIEKKEVSLQKLDPLFYDALEVYLKRKKEEIKQLKENDDLDKLKKEEKVLKNSISISKNLTSLRIQKITDLAIKNYFSEEVIFNPEDLEIELEREIYDKIYKSLSLFNSIYKK